MSQDLYKLLSEFELTIFGGLGEIFAVLDFTIKVILPMNTELGQDLLKTSLTLI